MKKLLALLLCLLLLGSAALAEGVDAQNADQADDAQTADDVDAQSVEYAPIEDGVQTLLGNTGVAVLLPPDWTAQETPQNYLAVYQSGDGAVTLSVLLGQKLSDCHNQIVALEEAGTAKDVAENYINDRYYLTYTSADDLYHFAYLPFSEDNCLIFCFGLADAAAPMDVPMQILGSAYIP